VVLGGDHPLALPLILDLESKGYIVIASVESSEATHELESKTNGYVCALLLDPNDVRTASGIPLLTVADVVAFLQPSTIPYFLRYLASTLSRRFPINVAGDMYATSSTQTYIHSIISLLSLPSDASSSFSAPPAAPLEHIPISASYSPYLQSSHLTPLQVIQSLVPLMRSSPARSRDKGSRSIIVCLPSTDTRVGLPFAGARAMSAAATLKGVEILRREVGIAALGEGGEGMRKLRIVTVDVGAVSIETDLGSQAEVTGHTDLMQGWTTSEKATYGPAFEAVAIAETRRGRIRTPSPVSVFVRKMVGIVDGESKNIVKVWGVRMWWPRHWFTRDRVSIGAGGELSNPSACTCY
jgi:hypothetical protein